jgi:N-acetylneuraminate synthase
MQIGKHTIGGDAPAFIVAEIGANHNGSVDKAIELMKLAQEVGADAVKFQKREPSACIPNDQKLKMKETPWGPMDYLDYRWKLEFGKDEYDQIASVAEVIGLDWFISVWDAKSVAFMEQYDPIAYKVGSPCLTDKGLLEAVRATHRPAILSTGMSTLEEVNTAVAQLGTTNATEIVLCHTTSAYPTPIEDINLRVLESYKKRKMFQIIPGFSCHHTNTITPAIVAVTLGAKYIEYHFTDDPVQWGSDQPISLDPTEFAALVHDVRQTETILGDGQKRVLSSEVAAMKKLRRYITIEEPVYAKG